eukprot:3261732-Heterocapsa_arctica.AAC.1
MSSFEETECLQWLEDHPLMKADAMKAYDRKLLDGLAGTGRSIAVKNIMLGNQFFDNLIGGPQADKTGKPQMDMGPVSCKAWVPWYTLKKFFTNDNVWDATLSDQDFWDIITETIKKHQFFHSFMIKILTENMTMIKATPKGGLKIKSEGKGQDGHAKQKQDPGGQK